MIGFHLPSPFDEANSAGEGEQGWYIAMKARPLPDKPLRAMLSTPCARAVFDSPDDAKQFLNHPGEIPTCARYYLDHHHQLLDGETNQPGGFTYEQETK